MPVLSFVLTFLLFAHGARGDKSDNETPLNEIDTIRGVPINPDELFDVIQGLTSQVGALTHQVAVLQAAFVEARGDREQRWDDMPGGAHAASCSVPRHPLGWSPRGNPSGISAGAETSSRLPISDALLPPSLAPKDGISWMHRIHARHLLSGSSAGAESNFDTSPRLNLTNGVKKICISPWQPIVKCSPAEDQSTYEGYMVNAFRGVAEELGWSNDSWNFECIETLEELWGEMLGEDGTCYMAAHGAQIVQSWLDMGVKFSIPTHRAGYSVLVKGSAQDPDMFAMFQVFGWDIWLMLGITSILVSVVILLMDAAPQYVGSKKSSNAVQPSSPAQKAPMQKREEGNDDAVPWYEALAGMTYDNIGLLVATGGPEGTSCPAKFVILAYGLLVVLILALFTANTAAYVTTKALSSSIRGISDLPNRKVAALGPMVDNLVNKYGIKKADITALPANAWVEDFWGLLKNGDVEALVVPDHAAEFTASVQCETFVAGGLFEQVFLGFAFPPVTPDIDIYAFSNGLIALDERDNMLEQLKAEFIENLGESSCGEEQYSETDTVMFDQVAGLWVILAFATYLSTMYILLRWVYYGCMECCRKNSRQHESRPPSGVNVNNIVGGAASAKAPNEPLLPSLEYSAAPPQSLPVAQPASAPYGAQQPAVDANLMPPPAASFPDSATQAAEEGAPRTEFMPQDSGTSQMSPNPSLRPTSAMPQRAGMLPPL